MTTGRRLTIAGARAQGLKAIDVWCVGNNGHHGGRIEFEALGLFEDTVFLRIQGLRRFKCMRCGNRLVEVRPRWTDVKFPMGPGAR
jgi:hypothetical protein